MSVPPVPADNDATDAALMRLVQEGRSDRFALLVERYERPLLRVARSRLGRVDWAEEAVQETFLSAFKSAHTFDPRYSFRTWLWTILLNQCRTLHRRRARDVRAASRDGPFSLEEHAEDMPRRLVSGEPAPLECLLAKERTAQLEALLGHLSEVQADAVRLRFFGGLKFHEIAETMGCSLSTAKNRVRWGLTKLTEMIGEMADDVRHELAPVGIGG
ncbi:MAG: RNA polymerase sigma factor, partial [Planctomycetes bacterium]|nr:RNA polymerase sigma factor [Planctomycetota bacterium]